LRIDPRGRVNKIAMALMHIRSLLQKLLVLILVIVGAILSIEVTNTIKVLGVPPIRIDEDKRVVARI
jgi:hypothetical protein